MEPTRERMKESTRPYLEAEIGFRNHWYPALFADELGEEPKPVTMLGEKILIRRIDGQLYAIEDRCAHRRVQLSAKLECYTKDTVTCWYHGFTYSFRDGSLVQVLTDPECPLIGKLRVHTYPIREAAARHRERFRHDSHLHSPPFGRGDPDRRRVAARLHPAG
jgi:carbazole 1,9a-dioxygenase terminal dioxygenase component